MIDKSLNILIPAGGNAERVFPFSKDVSKLLLKVNNKHVIDLIIEEIKTLFKDKYKLNIKIIVKANSLEVESYCKKYHKDIEILYIEKTNNPVDTIKFGLQYFNSTCPLLIWLSDTLITNTKKLPIGKNFVCTKELEDQYKWCICKDNKYYNKPSECIKGGKALIGIYGFKHTNKAKDAFSHASKDETEISDILLKFQSSTHEIDSFYNFGDLGDYYKSCSNLLKFNFRPNNNLIKDENLPIITKTSNNVNKIKSEYLWYKNIKKELKLNIPTIIDFSIINKQGSLTMSYEPGYLLSDLFLDSEFKESLWKYLLQNLSDLLLKRFYIKKYSIFSKLNSYNIWVKKSKNRLNKINEFSPIEKSKLLNIANALYKNSKYVKLIHGDLHFGNIIFDFNKNKFIFLDPRGSFRLSKSSGDIQYDLCKLFHSVYYMYLSNGLKFDNTKIYAIDKLLKEIINTKFNDLNLDLIKQGALLLIATCVDFHPKYRDNFIKFVKTNL